jgi:hypothetical protein
MFETDSMFRQGEIEIPLQSIKIQQIEYPAEMWGVVRLEGLPFYFRRSRVGLRHQNFEAPKDRGLFRTTSVNNAPIKWMDHGLYRPYTPHPIPAQGEFFKPPIFSGDLGDDYYLYFLTNLGVNKRLISFAESNQGLRRLYRRVVACSDTTEQYSSVINNHQAEGRKRSYQAIAEASDIVLKTAGYSDGPIIIYQQKPKNSNSK